MAHNIPLESRLQKSTQNIYNVYTSINKIEVFYVCVSWYNAFMLYFILSWIYLPRHVWQKVQVCKFNSLTWKCWLMRNKKNTGKIKQVSKIILSCIWNYNSNALLDLSISIFAPAKSLFLHFLCNMSYFNRTLLALLQ